VGNAITTYTYWVHNGLGWAGLGMRLEDRG